VQVARDALPSLASPLHLYEACCCQV
jgi:hypothetical protein